MPKGGARIRSGPAPDPNALRRERDWKEWTPLSPRGREKEPPEWPESAGVPSLAEQEMWDRLWRTPQALVWEADGLLDAVALYVRSYLEAQLPGAPAATRTLVLRMQGDLLLTTASLHAMRYVIADGPGGTVSGRTGPTQTPQGLPRAAGDSPRNRLAVVATPDED